MMKEEVAKEYAYSVGVRRQGNGGIRGIIDDFLSGWEYGLKNQWHLPAQILPPVNKVVLAKDRHGNIYMMRRRMSCYVIVDPSGCKYIIPGKSMLLVGGNAIVAWMSIPEFYRYRDEEETK